ncbi:MAG: hypothetical protein LBH14_01350 [Desulfobulbaceae bacterium]|jgi:type II secretory pathway pseudopilin PulG|nr:hypothetical protein [Desulfobulbaceae bacterium]
MLKPIFDHFVRMKNGILFSLPKPLIRSGALATSGEGGFVLITVMLVMVLLLALALAAASTSVLNTMIENNNRQYTVHFHAAEGAAMEAAQLLNAEEDPAILNPASGIEALPVPACVTPPCPPARLVIVKQVKNNPALDPEDAYYSENPLATQYDDNPALWNPSPGDLAPQPRQAAIGADEPAMKVQQVVVYKGSPLGESLVDGDKVYQYEIYGRAAKASSQPGKGDTAVTIAIGYKRRMLN